MIGVENLWYNLAKFFIEIRFNSLTKLLCFGFCSLLVLFEEAMLYIFFQCFKVARIGNLMYILIVF